MALNVVFVGNVDNGKSTTCGHLLKQLSYITEREFQNITNSAIQIKQEKSKYAHIMDTLKEEQESGTTRNAILIPFKISLDKFQEDNKECPSWLYEYIDQEINFIDTPGHKQLVKAMIEGAYLADVALLLVSVKQGEFETSKDSQTMEHLFLLRGLGVKQLLIVYNKMDTIEWDMSKVNDYDQQLQSFIKPLAFPSVRRAYISAWQGLGLVENYQGDSLLKQVLQSKKRPEETKVVVDPKNIICQMVFLQGDYKLVSKGFLAIMHNEDRYFDIEIIDIPGKTFLRKGDKAKIVLCIHDKLNNVDMLKNIILRKDDLTIAMGIIIE